MQPHALCVRTYKQYVSRMSGAEEPREKTSELRFVPPCRRRRCSPTLEALFHADVVVVVVVVNEELCLG